MRVCMCIIFKQSYSSFCIAIPDAERGPFDLEALAEGADTVFTMLILPSSNYQLALISTSPISTSCFHSLCSRLQSHFYLLGMTLTEKLIERFCY